MNWNTETSGMKDSNEVKALRNNGDDYLKIKSREK